MIRLLSPQDEPALRPAGGGALSAPRCKLLAALAAYGWGTPFLHVWAQGGPARAVIARLDGEILLEAGPGADAAEVEEFLSFLGGGPLFTDQASARALGWDPRRAPRILSLCAQPGPAPAAGWDPSPRDIYALLGACREESFPVPEFEGFFLDLSHRTRHGAAKTAALRENGALTAAACAVYSPYGSVVPFVAVRPGFRRAGRGARVLRALLSRVPGPVYLVPRDGLDAFYRPFLREPSL